MAKPFGTSAADLQSAFMGAGGSAPGAMMAQMASMYGPLPALMGGNYMSIADKSHAAAVYGATAGGNLLDNLRGLGAAARTFYEWALTRLPDFS